MKYSKLNLCNAIAYLLLLNFQLEYCLVHYDEVNKQLNDELDNCNYFGDKV